MAIYSLNLGFISRSEGRSSVGFSAYISGGRCTDERTGNSFNYSHKNEVIAGRVLAPGGAPSWALDRSTLWNQVEQFEDQIADLRFRGGEKSQAAKEKFLNSAQTAQTVMGALPLELNSEQWESCVKAFLKDRFVSRGLVVEYAIHDDKGNPHFHAMVTRRALEDGQFSQRKDRGIVSKPEHNITRKLWADVVNKNLERTGHDVRIDARSNEDRGSLFQSTEHEGWHAQRLAEQGLYSRIVADNEAARQKNIRIILEKPEALIQEVSLKRVAFTKRHIEDEIIKRVGGDAELYSLLKSKLDGVGNTRAYDAADMKELAAKISSKLLADESVTHPLGENINHEKIFTSQDYKTHEESILVSAEKLNSDTRIVSDHWIQEAISNREKELGGDLSPEQKQAIQHLCSGPDIRILNGKAGTGKTTLLKAVAEAYAKTGYTVMGTSFQGKAVEIMQAEIGIPCRTLDSHLHQWQQHEKYKNLVEGGKLWGQPYLRAHQKIKQLEKSHFKSTDVIIVDEANMISSKLWDPFLKEASRAGAKVIVVQDPAQIKSRDVGDVGRLLSDKYGFAETNAVIRQKVEWQKKASSKLNNHEILDGLQPYYEKGHINWFMNAHAAIGKLSQDYLTGSGNRMVLAYTNQEVRSLNHHIRSAFKNRGDLTNHFQIAGMEYSTGDRIRFTQNDNHGQFVKNVPDSFKERFTSDKSVGVKNGSLGTIISFEKDHLTVKLDDGRMVKTNTKDYAHFTHGYAMSIHKSEGSTFDRAYVLASRFMDPSTTLVAMTRHKQDVQLYVNSDQFVDFKDLVDTCSKGEIRDTLQDYTVTPAQQPFLDRIVQHRDLLNEIITLREEMEVNLKPETPLFKHPSYGGYQVCLQQKKEVAKTILNDWKNHSPYARLAGIRKDVLEVEVGARKRHLSDIEQRAQIQVDIYKDLSKETKTLWAEIQKTHPGSLGQNHQLYPDYKEQKTERDGLAYLMAETPKLYRQFCSGDNAVYWQAVQSHAKAHKIIEEEKSYVRGLSPEEKTSYETAKDYVAIRNTAAALYAQVKGGQRDLLDEFKKSKIKRDELAISVVKDASETHLKKLNVNPEKLLVHATHGEIRSLAKEYLDAPDTSDKQQKKDALKKALTDKSHYHIVRNSGVDPRSLNAQQPFTHTPSKPKEMPLDAETVLRAAEGKYDRIARDLLGPENKAMSNTQTLRFGSKGSLVINIDGPKAGLWKDFSTDDGGGMLNLIMRESSCDFKTALKDLANHLNVRSENRFEAPKPKPQKTPYNDTAEQIQKLAAVQSLRGKSTDIKGTTAETYLRKTRAITCEPSDDLRAIPKGTTFLYKGAKKNLRHDCFAAFSRCKDGTLQSVQLTRLSNESTRAKAPDGTSIPKTKYGMGKDAFVTLQSNPKSNTVIIAEGVETALSLKQVGINATIVASQGIHNIKNYKGPETKIIIAADNDDHKKESATHKVIAKAEQYFKSQGKHTTIIKPQTPGQDFNDVLKEKGVGGVKKSIQKLEINKKLKSPGKDLSLLNRV